jgi:hypothetical protein
MGGTKMPQMYGCLVIGSNRTPVPWLSAPSPPSPPSPGLSDNNYQFLPEAVKKAAVINARVALALHRFQLCVNDIRFG